MEANELFKCADGELRTIREIMARIELLSDRMAEDETGKWSLEVEDLREDFQYATGEEY